MTDKIDIEDKAEVEKAARQMMRIPPSRRRVLEMTDKLLLSNYALIAHRASSLSSSQRKMVEARIAYGVRDGRIKMEDVTEQVNDLTKYIEQQLTKAENGSNNDDSAIKQGQSA
jgi:hypothetical protein